MVDKVDSLLANLKSYAAEQAKELKKLARADLTVDTVEANVAGQKIAFKVIRNRKGASLTILLCTGPGQITRTPAFTESLLIRRENSTA